MAGFVSRRKFMNEHVKTSTSSITAPNFQTEIPEAISEMIKPVVLVGENASHATALYRVVSENIAPKGIIETLLTIDACYASCDILRMHRLKAAVINAHRKSAVKHLSAKLLNNKRTDYNDQLHRLSNDYFTNETVKAEFEINILRPFGLTPESINAQALIECVSEVAALDNLLGTAMSRRDTALREIKRGREALLVDKGEVVDHEECTETGSESEPPKTAQDGVP
jgi:hypothetical protein